MPSMGCVDISSSYYCADPPCRTVMPFCPLCIHHVNPSCPAIIFVETWQVPAGNLNFQRRTYQVGLDVVSLDFGLVLHLGIALHCDILHREGFQKFLICGKTPGSHGSLLMLAY